LAADSVLNVGHEKALPITYTTGTQYSLTDVAGQLPSYWVGKQAYSVTFGEGATKRDLILVPFADAGQAASPLQVWLPFKLATTAKK